MSEPIHRCYYLHYWNNDQNRWTSEDEEKQTNYGGLMFPEFGGAAKDYPWGYKMYHCRNLADAPLWVIAKRQELLGMRSNV